MAERHFRQDGQAPTVLPLGVVIRRAPGVTRWAAWSWRPVAVLPGAGPADWTELRRAGDTVEYHAATLPLELWPPEAESYRTALAARVPSVGVVLRGVGRGDARPRVVLVTASPFEAQDYLDSGDEQVELVPMPSGLVALLGAFTDLHHTPVPFKKRRRDRSEVDRVQNGIGDARVRQPADIYRAPTGTRRRTT